MDDLRLEQAVDRLGQGIVVAITDAANGGFDAGVAQPLGVANGQVLRAAVATCMFPGMMGARSR